MKPSLLFLTLKLFAELQYFFNLKFFLFIPITSINIDSLATRKLISTDK
ncbi:MAG: hypothetical protein KF758_12170 [Anaerolineales bacterium]|nr:hypothetical protein [Anaerolineales bacterium]